LKANLKHLKLPTVLAEYEKLAREAADRDEPYDGYLLRLTEAEVAARAANALAVRRIVGGARHRVRQAPGRQVAAADQVLQDGRLLPLGGHQAAGRGLDHPYRIGLDASLARHPVRVQAGSTQAAALFANPRAVEAFQDFRLTAVG
jgi:hypothetical protein